MADINQSVQISYTADISDLLKEIEKLPGASKEEAQKLTKEISKALKDTEKASKKAAATNSKSMQRMSMSAKKAGQEFKRLKRSASEIGRGLTDLAVIFGDVDSPMGEFVNKIGVISVTGGALLPLFASLRTAVIGLGASTAMATGGLSLLAGAAAYAIFSMGQTDEAAEKQAKALTLLSQKYRKFRDELEKSIKKNEEFKETVMDTFEVIQNAGREFEQQKYELMFELGQIGAKEFRQLVQGAKIAETYEDIQKNFDEREKALVQQLANETKLANDAVRSLFNAANELGKPIMPHQIDLLRLLGEQAELTGMTNSELKTQINDILPNLTKRLQDEAMLVAKMQGMRARSNADLNKFNSERSVEQAKQEAQAEEILELEEKLWWQSQKTNDAKDKQGEIIARNLAHLEKMAALEDDAKNSMLNQAKIRVKMLDDELSRSFDLVTLQEKITKEHQIQNIELKNQIFQIQKQQNKNLENATSLQEVVKAHETNAELQNEIGLLEEQRQQLTLSNMAKIAAEEERINQIRLQGIGGLIGNLQNFATSAGEALAKSNDEQIAFQDKLFRMQQAFAVAKIAMDAAGGAVNALATYGPVLGPILAGTIAASAGAQTAVVMSQQPPSASAHMGQPLAPDEQTIRVLTGEAVLDRRTVQSLGGEQGIRNMQEGNTSGSEVIVLNTFKHFDKYNKSARRQMGTKRRGSGAY